MMMTVGVPDVERGFVLAGLLGRYEAEVVSRGDAFEVVLGEPPEHELAAVLSQVEHWMHDESVEAALVKIDGRSYMMEPNAGSAISGPQTPLQTPRTRSNP
jgi:hypothetical protein